MSKFDDIPTNPTLTWRVDLTDITGEVIRSSDQSIATKWGARVAPLRSELGRYSQRTSTLIVPVDDDSLIPVSGSILHPEVDSMVQLWCGVVGESSTTWFCKATMLIDEAYTEIEEDGVTVELRLVDPLQPLRSEIPDFFEMALDTPVEDVVEELALQVLSSDRLRIAQTGYTVPRASVAPGTNRLDLITQLLEGCGHEITADCNGAVITREIPRADDEPFAERWRYGSSGVQISTARRITRRRVPQSWIVRGGSEASIAPEVQVFDLDPSSEGYFARRGGTQHVGTSDYPYVRSVGQAVAAGYAQLRRFGSGPGIIEFKTIPNPGIEEGDLLELDLDEIRSSGTYRVIGAELPLHLDGLMTVVAREQYSPSLGYLPPDERGPSCLTSITDTFERPNGNLENLGGDGGSPDWTENGWSWGIDGFRAIQRYANGWSHAYVNTPLCSSDHEVSIDIETVPRGRWLGPSVRSTGEFDGYKALTDSDGNVRLEYWQAARKVAVLGSFSNGASLNGRDLKLKVVDSTLTVTIGSDEVITATDSRARGRHVGMLAFGGPATNAPSVNSFSAVAAS